MNNVYGSTTATSTVGLIETRLVNTCVGENNEKPEAVLYLVSGNTRNQIVLACICHIRAMHMTSGKTKKDITIY